MNNNNNTYRGGRGFRQGRGGRQQRRNYSHPYYCSNRGASRRSNNRSTNNRNGGRNNFIPNHSPLTYERSYIILPTRKMEGHCSTENT